MVLSEKSVSWSLLLERLQEVVPWEVRLDLIRTATRKEGIGLSLDLTTSQPEYYWDFIERLEGHDCFADVYPSHQTDLPSGDIEVTLQLIHDPWCGGENPNPVSERKRGRRRG